MYSDELCHYGVIGMKWGVHRARKQGKKYQYKSMSTHRYEHRLAKAKTSGDKAAEKVYKRRLNRSKSMDSREQKIAENMSVGELAVDRIVLWGGFTGKSRQRYEAMGRSKAESLLLGAASTFLTGDLLSVYSKYKYLREGEKQNKIR